MCSCRVPIGKPDKFQNLVWRPKVIQGNQRTCWRFHGKTRSRLIYVGTHIVLWLYAGLGEKFPATACYLNNEHTLLISPIVRLGL